MSYKKEIIKEVKDMLLDYGFIVYLSDCETYGFYTDENEKTLVCFQTDFLSVIYSGSYKSNANIGQGWRMDGTGILSKDTYTNMLRMGAPRWATRGNSYKLKTVRDHLNLYTASNYKRAK